MVYVVCDYDIPARNIVCIRYMYDLQLTYMYFRALFSGLW